MGLVPSLPFLPLLCEKRRLCFDVQRQEGPNRRAPFYIIIEEKLPGQSRTGTSTAGYTSGQACSTRGNTCPRTHKSATKSAVSSYIKAAATFYAAAPLDDPFCSKCWPADFVPVGAFGDLQPVARSKPVGINGSENGKLVLGKLYISRRLLKRINTYCSHGTLSLHRFTAKKKVYTK